MAEETSDPPETVAAALLALPGVRIAYDPDHGLAPAAVEIRVGLTIWKAVLDRYAEKGAG